MVTRILVLFFSTALLAATGCNRGATSPGKNDSRAADKKSKLAEIPGKGDLAVLSGWSIKAPVVTPLEGEFKSKYGTYADEKFNQTIVIPPKSGNRLVRFECNFTAVEEDTQAIETFSERRKAIFKAIENTGQCKQWLWFYGDGFLSPQIVKQNLKGKYRVFDMERIALADPTNNAHKPVWCIEPPADWTLIFTPDGILLQDRWVAPPKNLIMRASVRTNACPQLKIGDTTLMLIEIDHPVGFSLLFQIPESVDLQRLNLVVDGGATVSVKLKK